MKHGYINGHRTRHRHRHDTLTWIIIWENDIIQCNRRCRVGVRHRRMSDTGTPLIWGVSVLHRYKVSSNSGFSGAMALYRIKINKLLVFLFSFCNLQLTTLAYGAKGLWTMAIMLSVENKWWLTLCFYPGWLTRGCWLSGWLATEGGSSEQECTNPAWAVPYWWVGSPNFPRKLECTERSRVEYWKIKKITVFTIFLSKYAKGLMYCATKTK